MVTIQLRRFPTKSPSAEDVVNRVNDLTDIHLGNAGGRIRLRGYSGDVKDIGDKGSPGAVLTSNNYPLDVQSPLGFHAAFVLSATSATAAPSTANSAVLITDAGLSIGAGKGFRIYETSGVDYTELTDVDGMLLVGGSGADAGSLTLSGSSRRLVSDMTTNRFFFQTNVADQYTYLAILPKGASVISGIAAYNASDIANNAYVDMLITSTEARLLTGKTGTGTYVPLSLYAGGSKRIGIDPTTGLVSVKNAVAVGTTPSTVGLVRLANNDGMYARNAGNTADIPIVVVSAADAIAVGQSGTALGLKGTVTATSIDPPTVEGQITNQSQAKAYLYYDVAGGGLVGGGGGLGDNYNIVSVTKNGTGDFTVTIDRDFAAATYVTQVTVQDNASVLTCRVNGQAVGSFDVHFRNAATVLTDPDGFACVCFGTLS